MQNITELEAVIIILLALCMAGFYLVYRICRREKIEPEYFGIVTIFGGIFICAIGVILTPFKIALPVILSQVEESF